jgi:hypothetical protein
VRLNLKSDQEYFMLPNVIHSGELSRMYHDGPDAFHRHITTTHEMVLGHVLEWYWEEYIACANNNFTENCIVIETDSNAPKDFFDLIGADDFDEAVDALNRKRLKADGTPNLKNVSFYEWVDGYRECPGKFPINLPTWYMIKKQSESASTIPVANTTLGELAKHCEYQVPFQVDDRVCLVDMLYIGENTVYSWDFKQIKNFSAINGQANARWWIQGEHYTSILKGTYPDKDVKQMDFIVCSKSDADDFLAKRVIVESNEYTKGAYLDLVQETKEWINKGKPKAGHALIEIVRPFIKQRLTT